MRSAVTLYVPGAMSVPTVNVPVGISVNAPAFAGACGAAADSNTVTVGAGANTVVVTAGVAVVVPAQPVSAISVIAVTAAALIISFPLLVCDTFRL